MNQPDMRIRHAEVRDAEAILDLYAPYVESTAITFETRVPSLSEFEERMKGIVGHYPYLVAVERDAVVGYAYAHRQAERAAYQWNAELSVYLARERTGHGLGRTLSQAVIELLRLQGVRNVFSLITLPNEPSVHLHRALGFQQVGTQIKAGCKLGAWHDVGWFQKQIGDFENEPGRVLNLREIDGDAARIILKRAERDANEARTPKREPSRKAAQ